MMEDMFEISDIDCMTSDAHCDSTQSGNIHFFSLSLRNSVLHLVFSSER